MQIEFTNEPTIGQTILSFSPGETFMHKDKLAAKVVLMRTDTGHVNLTTGATISLAAASKEAHFIPVRAKVEVNFGG